MYLVMKGDRSRVGVLNDTGSELRNSDFNCTYFRRKFLLTLSILCNLYSGRENCSVRYSIF